MLFLSFDKFPPFRVDVAVLFGQEMVGRGHIIEWILQSSDDCRASYHTTWRGCSVWVGATDNRPTFLGRLKKHLLDMKNDLTVFRLMRSTRYDLIQVKDKFFAGLLGLAAARLTGAWFTFWLSYPEPEASIYMAEEGSARYPLLYLARGLITKFLLYRVIMPLADHVFVQSEQMKRDVAAEGIPVHKLTAVPMGVSLNAIPYKQEGVEEGTSEGEKRVLYLGTLNRVRKIDFLIRVFAFVLQEVPEARLYLVGSGDDPEDQKLLEELAQKLGIEKQVLFTGFLPMRQAWGYVGKAAVCVSPFFPTAILNSTSPTKLIEYMAMGKPVVANDHPEQRLVISESNGGICVPYDEKAFAAAIVALLKDPGRAKKMGLRGREYVQEHRNYTCIASSVETKYFDVCSEIRLAS